MLIRTNVTNIGDPLIFYEEPYYWMYCSDYDVIGVKARRSKDLANWEDLGVVCDMRNTWAHEAFWAPEVYRYKGKYIMNFSSRIAKDNTLRVAVAIADKPEGPFIDPINGPLFDFGYACIDAHIFVDDDDQKYLFYSRDCSGNKIGDYKVSQTFVAKLSDDFCHLISDPVLVTTPDKPYDSISAFDRMWNEGPFVLKHDGEYYLTYAANFYASANYCTCLAKAKNPMGPYIKDDVHNPIVKSLEKGNDFAGPGHNSLFYDKDGNLKIAFHILTDEYHPSANRKAVIMDAKFEDGTIKVF